MNVLTLIFAAQIYVIQPDSVEECADNMRAPLGLDNIFHPNGTIIGTSISTPLRHSQMWCEAGPWLGIALLSLIFAQIVAMPVWLITARYLGKMKVRF